MSAATQRDAWIGSMVLGRYRVVQILAVGGMGAVYLGRAEGARGFVRPVVIKRILSSYAEDDEAVAMFVREARILSQLQDPGIVSVLDFGLENDDTLVMVLEYVHGYHLGYWQAFTQRTAGKMEPDVASYIVTRVLDALSHAHNYAHPDGRRMQIVHRDISPSNVLLDIHGNVKLVDFGIAKLQGDDVDEYKTQAPRLKGKFSYMPSELFRGDPPSVQSDVYACGVMLYELLAGSNPFRARTMAETYDKIRTVTPMTLGALRDDVSPELDAAIAKAMSQDPALRFASAVEFGEALRKARGASDELVRSRLREQLADAYAGPLAEVLEIEPLTSRSAAWQDAGSGTRDPALEVLSIPPSSDQHEQATAIVDGPPRMMPERTLTAPGLPGDGATVNVPPPSTLVEATRSRDVARPVLLLGVGAALIVLAIAGAFWIGRQQPTAQSERVVVIERQPGPAAVRVGSANEVPATSPAVAGAESADEPAHPVENEPSEVAPPEVTESVSAATAAPAQRRKAEQAGAPDPRHLTRAFSRHQSRVEQCFTQFPGQVGADSLSIKFDVNERGAVQSAELVPAPIGDTPLGRCLLAVARGASFPPQREPIAFRIPITARRM